MNKFLLTGGTGTLGTELQKHLDCFAPDRKLLDITRTAKENVSELWWSKNIGPENIRGIIHAAAYTDVPGAETNRKIAIKSNITGTKNIANLAKEYGVPVYYISTDYVYEGIFGNYHETDLPSPINFYSFTKLAGEAYMDPDKDLIIRTSFKSNDLYPRKYTRAFADIHTSADFVDIVAEDIAFAIHSNLRGIYNIGAERKSLYELAKRRYPGVEKMYRAEVCNVNMPIDISLNTGRYLYFKKKHLKEFEDFTANGK